MELVESSHPALGAWLVTLDWYQVGHSVLILVSGMLDPQRYLDPGWLWKVESKLLDLPTIMTTSFIPLGKARGGW